MQIPTLWKRITAGATGLGAILATIIAWDQLELGRPAWSTDNDLVHARIDKLTERIDGIDKLNLYRERDRVEDKIDELEERLDEDPGNRAIKELIKLRHRERDEIDRQIDGLQ